MEEINILFKDYIDEFKKLNIDEKRLEIINSLKELIASIDAVAYADNIKLHYLKSNEINDIENIKNKPVDENDFLEANIVYLEVAKNLLGEYLINKENL